MAAQAESIRCHYDVLGVEQDADLATIKKQHRKLALKYHPDKNLGDDGAAEVFRLVQQAYETLSDTQERKWYDDHRDAILSGWSAGKPGQDDASKIMLFNVIPYMYAGCYTGYDSNQPNSFYQVYSSVFSGIVECERRNTDTLVDEFLPTDFGDASTDWSNVQQFYQSWESFSSVLNFSWEDKYNVHEDAPNRRVRRLMEDENKKARRSGKKTYNADILALVAFCKRRDPRVKAKQEELQQQKIEREKELKEQAAVRKQEQAKAKQAWKEQAQRDMEQAEEEDRLAGRVRLADLEDDYDYGGGKKGKKKRGKKKKNKAMNYEDEEDDSPEQPDGNQEVATRTDGESDEAPLNAVNELSEASGNDCTNIKTNGNEPGQEGPEDSTTEDLDDLDEYGSEDEDEEEEEEEPDVWRCECCRKDFKSEGQMENHMKSKKHKEAWKKYQSKLKKKEEELLNDMMDDMDVGR